MTLLRCLLSTLVPRIGRTLAFWRERREHRSDLMRLLRAGPHLIKDIGLSIHEAKREAEKPFWWP